ncbi:DUF756 domain-containing protein [Caballeronia sp. M1242]|uniref:DUF756 domain-containing protein n=1 Tax=Caballeronia sp. M1242 TaxID=2814653 RepID=UPI0019D10B06|nr:DUF756 domain-containing protein [Caballeronia sp. M1242]QSN64272.1 DUF756 domain-containing protein [Caballeronia sp. M1242]
MGPIKGNRGGRSAGFEALTLGAGNGWTISTNGALPAALFWNIAHTGCWFDFEVTRATDRSFFRRIAGRMETGRHSVTDPATSMADSF